MNKIITSLSLAFLFLVFPFFVKAAVCDESTVLKVVARDPGGNYISGASVEIYTQTTDANGDKKPDKKLTSGTTSATLGSATLTFKNSAVSSATYAIKIRTVAKDSANFWFYDNNLSCGENTTIEKTLSGLQVSLFKANGEIFTNAKFNIYTQLYDANGALLQEKNELLGSFNSGASGRTTVYLPQGSVRSLDGRLKDYYVLEVINGSVKSYAYNIKMNDGQLTTMNYSLSILKTRLKYEASGSAVGAVVEVYTQKVDSAGKEQLDTKVGSYTIADNGYGSMDVSPGTYALRIKSAGEYQYFWDLSVGEGGTTQFLLELKGSANSVGSKTACATDSKVYVTLRDMAGNVIPGLKFELYEQTTDANNLPIAGNKVGNGTTDATGRATLSFKPDSAKSYALKVWDKKDNLGHFWFFGVVKFVCGYDRNLSQSLPALKIVLRDANGQPKYDYAFSLYSQRYDVDGNPTFSSSDLIASLKTGADGQAVVYVSPYNSYNNNQSGIYAISTKDGSGNVKNFYDIKVREDKDYTFDPSFSGLKGEFVDLTGKALANKNFTLYEQKTDGNYLSLGNKLFTFKTDSSGRFEFEYPSGRYAAVVNDDLNSSNIFWNISVGEKSSYLKLSPSSITFRFSPAAGSTDKSISLKLYSLSGRGGTYYQDKQVGTVKLENNTATLSLAAGAYLVTYAGANNQIYGQAFYAKNGLAYTVSFSPNGNYLLGDKKTFSLRDADSNLVSATSVNNSNSNNSNQGTVATGSLSNRVKGRILLQVEDKGQAWYVNPSDNRRYSLGRPEDAFLVMRQVALGVSNQDFAALEKNPSAWSRLAGRILIKPEDNGRAYYFDPTTLKLHYLGRPQDAFNIMRNLGLGITNNDLNKINANN